VATATQLIKGLLAKAEALFRAGDCAGVGTICQRILQANQTSPDAWHLLGAVAHKEARFAEAEELILRAISLSKSNPYYRNSLGNVQRAQGKFESAAAAYRKTLRLDPGMNVALRGLGICLRALGDLSGSVLQLERLVSISPKDVEAHTELATSLRSIGQLDAALVHARTALGLQPGHQRAQRCLAETLLLAGNFSVGWQEYLRSLTTVSLPKPDPSSSPFNGRRAVVYGSEGVGDEIMAVGCMSELADQTDECTLYTDERLVTLFQRSFPSVHCIGKKKTEGEKVLIGLPTAQEIHLLSPMLFPYLRPNPREDAQQHAYLVPDSAALAKWRERYRELGPGLTVGLSWRGGGDPESRFNRSIALTSWEPVLRIPNIQFVNLQYGDTAAETNVALACTGTKIHHWPATDPLRDLDDFAAQIAALELVITVDNTTAHMAGALGVPVWTLLAFAPSWRWMLGREDTPWYSAMRLLRQVKPCDWNAVLDQVRIRLLDKISP
jgi:Flp pilus assembly protein TadD